MPETMKEFVGSGPAYLMRSAGIGTLSSANINTLFTVANCTSRAIYQPYPSTQLGNILTTTGGGFNRGAAYIGKAATITQQAGQLMLRYRLGITFQLSPSYSANTQFRLYVPAVSFFNDLEPWTPRIYLSNTDDASLYTSQQNKAAWDWESNLNVLIGGFPYGSLANYIPITYAMLSPRFNARASFILGSDKEFSGTGATGGIGNAYAQLYTDINPNVQPHLEVIA